MLPMAASGRRDKIVERGFEVVEFLKASAVADSCSLRWLPATRNKLYLRYLYRQLSREAVRCQCYDPV